MSGMKQHSAAIRWLLQGISYQTREEKRLVAQMPLETESDEKYRDAIRSLIESSPPSGSIGKAEGEKETDPPYCESTRYELDEAPSPGPSTTGESTHVVTNTNLVDEPNIPLDQTLKRFYKKRGYAAPSPAPLPKEVEEKK